MSWFDVDCLPLPELDWLLRTLNTEQERENKKGQDNLEQIGRQFELTKRLKAAGAIPEGPPLDPVQKKRLEKLKRIKERHPIPEAPK